MPPDVDSPSPNDTSKDEASKGEAPKGEETPPADERYEMMAAQIAAQQVTIDELKGLLDVAANRITELESRCTGLESRDTERPTGSGDGHPTESPQAQETDIGGSTDHPPQETHWYWRQFGG